MNWPTSSAFRLASVSTVSAALLLATTSCEDPNDLGVELPGTSPISTEYRDLPVAASTILQDSVETLNADRVLLGRVTDSDIGTTTARAYFNLRIANDTLPSQFTGTQLDSVVVVSAFDAVYGSKTAPVSFDLYNMAAGLDDRQNYNAATSNVPLGSQIGEKLTSSLRRTITQNVVVAGLKSKVKKDALGNFTVDSTVAVTSLDPTIRLVLHKDKVRTSAFANELFSALKDASFNQTKLAAFWKGLAIAPSDNQTNAIVGLSRASTNRIFVYYRGIATGRTAATPHIYTIRMGTSYTTNDPNTPRYFTNIATAFKAPFDQLLNGKNSVTLPDNVAFLQEGIGLATKLSIPGLEEFKNQSALAINRAELIIPVKSGTTLQFENAPLTFLYEVNANNRVLLRTTSLSPVERVVQENLQNPLGQGKEAGVLLTTRPDGSKYYSVVLTTYLQASLANQLGEQAAALVLSPTLRRLFGLSLNRSVIDAQNIKLRVYSSKLR